MQSWLAELQELVQNVQNVHYSNKCLSCKKSTKSTVKTPNSQSCDENKRPDEECAISACWLSLGGDWEFIARLLGLTGPNGTYFCNFCDAQTKDLVKGKPHTPWLLQNGSLNDQTKQFSGQRVESILTDSHLLK